MNNTGHPHHQCNGTMNYELVSCLDNTLKDAEHNDTH